MSTYPSRMAEVFSRKMGVWRVFNSDEAQLGYCEDLADAWREACTITTVEQLDALPFESVIRDQDGIILAHNPRHVYPSQLRPWWPLSGYSALERDYGVEAESITLPALLIWSPDWERP
ncbi:hypothetical protein MHPYR_180083 [uncultured Mycobacterium sp.]|uniref:Uncharacterized protein n=1 Tax=uncultured Mycobacterium sp. TaxID=171292 RepID=A0A1Y5P567_9MYCO|nr:hypothetical protein MHPYR_180083 [uncultured Mycobacterium sp.]